MRSVGAVVLTIASMFLLTAPVSEDESVHNWFADDTNLIVEISLPDLMDLFAEEVFGGIGESISDDIATELLDHVKKVYVGVPGEFSGIEQDDEIYILLKTDGNANSLASIVEESAEELEAALVDEGLYEIKHRNEGNESVFIADAHDGMIVAGFRSGIKKYRGVISGEIPDASNNSDLVSLRKKLNAEDDVLVYGTSFPDEIGLIDLESFAFSLEYHDRILELSLFLKTDDEKALDKIQNMIEGIKSLAGVFDETGAFENILSGLNIDRRADGLKLTLTLPISFLRDMEGNRLVMNDLPFSI